MSSATPSEPDRPTVGPLHAEHLEPALDVIEAVQSLGALEDVPRMLEQLARQLTGVLATDACLISTVDRDRGLLRNRVGFRRPPARWERQIASHRIADYPRTEEVLQSGEPFTCVLGRRADRAEGRMLERLGFCSLLMLPLPVEDEPYALIEVYDRRPRRFSRAEVRLCQTLAAEAGQVVARARMQERLEDAYFATLGTLAAALEAKDAYTNDHASQIADLAGAVCDQLAIPAAEARMIRLGALLHDIGKIGIPEAILRKDGPLDEEEWAVMHEHPTIGARILEPVPYFAELVPLVASSHERFDGRGYPDRLVGDAIPLGSRVIAVCDAFHAMTEDRVYRKALPVREAITEIARCSGTQFDPRCVVALLNVVREQGWPRVTRDRLVRPAHAPV